MPINDTELTPGCSDDPTLSTSYLGAGNRYIVRGPGVVSIMLDDKAIGYTVQLQPVNTGTAKQPIERPMEAGVEWELPFSNGKRWYLDVKADSGTPKADIGMT